MSTLKCNNAQIGQSATASNNFTWYQPAVPDGTVRLGQGNSGATTQDVIKCDSSGNLTIPGSIYQGSGTVAAERIVVGTPQTTNGAAAYGYTGLPSWVKKITLTYTAVGSTNSVSRRVQVGTSSGYATSGYQSTCSWMLSGTSNDSTSITSYFDLTSALADQRSGVVQLFLVNSSTNTWAISATSQRDAQIYNIAVTSGYVTLSGTLDRIQLLVPTGTMNAGTVNIIYEG